MTCTVLNVIKWPIHFAPTSTYLNVLSVSCPCFHSLIIYLHGLIGWLIFSFAFLAVQHRSSFRLEQTFIESSQNYYTNEIRRVKKHKETLNNITHQLLHIRHQIKVAFFSELRQDIPSAVKSYKNAYSYLTENARIHDTNVLEMKMIAGFLTYKVDGVLLARLNERTSESRFRSVEFYSIRLNPSKRSIISAVMRISLKVK